jgi:hypothetical protein
MLRGSAAFKAYGTIMLYDRKSMYFFPGSSLFRQKVVSLFSNKLEIPYHNYFRHYDRFILFFVILASIANACFDYEDRLVTTFRNNVIRYLSILFTLIFTFDSVIRIIGQGFIIHRNSYLRNVFGWFDLLVILQG